MPGLWVPAPSPNGSGDVALGRRSPELRRRRQAGEERECRSRESPAARRARVRSRRGRLERSFTEDQVPLSIRGARSPRRLSFAVSAATSVAGLRPLPARTWSRHPIPPPTCVPEPIRYPEPFMRAPSKPDPVDRPRRPRSPCTKPGIHSRWFVGASSVDQGPEERVLSRVSATSAPLGEAPL